MNPKIETVRVTFALDGLIGREEFDVPERLQRQSAHVIFAELGVVFGQWLLTETLSDFGCDSIGLMDTFRILLLEWSELSEGEARP